MFFLQSTFHVDVVLFPPLWQPKKIKAEYIKDVIHSIIYYKTCLLLLCEKNIFKNN